LQGSAELIGKAKVDLVRAMRFSGDTESAVELIGEPNPNEPLYTLLCVELAFLLQQKNPKEARRFAMEAIRVAKAKSDLEALLKAVGVLGILTSQQQRKLALTNIAVKLAADLKNNHLLSVFWNELGVALYNANLRKEAFDAWTTSANYAEVVGNVRILITLEVNKALVLMQDADFTEAKTNLDHAVVLARRTGIQTVEKSAIYNRALCLYGLGQLTEARHELEFVRAHPLELVARTWESRITLELGDGFIVQLVEIQPQDFGHGYFSLAQVLLALTFGDYQKAWDMTAQPIHDSDWHWALARVHAGWRLGLRDEAVIEKVLFGQADDPALSAELTRAYSQFVALVLSDWTPEIRQQLQDLTAQFVASPIGVLARDVSLSLVED
jgi:tetratricopeptide (TPR) repeat protein